jgi:hypothetical protein
LFKTEKWKALDVLEKLVDVHAFGDGVLRELMSTSNIKELVSQGCRNTDKIREAAG